jgi:hypothetical protein
MKITKSKLKQLIKEELELILRERSGRPDPLTAKLVSLNELWLPAWDASSIKNNPASAFIEAATALKSHWFTTIPNSILGCSGGGSGTGECRTLLKLSKLWKTLPAKLLKLADKYDSRGKRPGRTHAIKMAKALDAWAPADQGGSFTQLMIWKKNLMRGDSDED